MPSVACHVGVLRTELDAAPVQFFPRSIQQLEPDTCGPLNQYARICRAIGETTRQESAASRARLGIAARIIELRRPIPYVFLGDWVIVSRSASILRPSVKVDIKFWVVEFKGGQALIAANEIQRTV